MQVEGYEIVYINEKVYKYINIGIFLNINH